MVRSINLLSLKLICLGRAMARFFRLDVWGGEKPGFCTADDGGCTLMNADEFWMCGVARNRVFVPQMMADVR